MESQKHDDDSRRRYWAEQMEAAHQFMQKMAVHPVKECGDPMESLPAASKQAGVEIRFSEAKTSGGADRIFWIRRQLVPNVIAAAREMEQRGWVLRVEDAYRTEEIQRGLALKESIFDAILARVRWELGGRTPTVQEMLRRVSVLVATCPKVGTHMSGSALDISVLRQDGSDVDRGGPYLEMSELTPMGSPFVSAEAQQNRREITALMARHGFLAYPWEFWHYSSGDAYFEHLSGTTNPARYGAVRLRLPEGRTEPIPNPTQSLHAEKDIQNQIERSLKRLKRPA